jgi:hypothetical protein
MSEFKLKNGNNKIIVVVEIVDIVDNCEELSDSVFPDICSEPLHQELLPR